jgi:hypothetical protein
MRSTSFLETIRRDDTVNSGSMLPISTDAAGDTLVKESTGPKGDFVSSTLAKAIGAPANK